MPILALDRYTSGEYLAANPSWHVEDSAWKAEQVIRMLDRHGLAPRTICEVGCGAGEILRQLHDRLDPATQLVGYDVTPEAIELARPRATDRLNFALADIVDASDASFDLILIMDVIEHLEDPFTFLRAVKARSRRQIVHLPLELYALSALRPHVILESRRAVGHIQYFLKDTAVALFADLGFRVVDWCYTDASAQYPRRTVKLNALHGARRLLEAFNHDLAARALGGYSLLVLME